MDVPMAKFYHEDTVHLLQGKHVVIMGDSVQRSVYKDFVLLVQSNEYLTEKQLKAKGEFNFLNDELINGGMKGEMKNDITYREERVFQKCGVKISFYFITRAYSTYVEEVLTQLENMKPDVLIMNSCIWDLTSYGSSAYIHEYQTNLNKLFERIGDILPESSLFIWISTLPVHKQPKGGLFSKSKHKLNEDVPLSNIMVEDIASRYGYYILQIHDIFKRFVDMRAPDGVHWNNIAHRRITNILLCKMAHMWGMPLPSNDTFSSPMLSHAEVNRSRETPVMSSIPPLLPLQYDNYEDRYNGPIGPSFNDYMPPQQDRYLRKRSHDQCAPLVYEYSSYGQYRNPRVQPLLRDMYVPSHYFDVHYERGPYYSGNNRLYYRSSAQRPVFGDVDIDFTSDSMSFEGANQIKYRPKKKAKRKLNNKWQKPTASQSSGRQALVTKNSEEIDGTKQGKSSVSNQETVNTPKTGDATNPEMADGNKQEGMETDCKELVSVTTKITTEDETLTGEVSVNKGEEVTVGIPKLEAINAMNPDNQESSIIGSQEQLPVTTHVAIGEETVAETDQDSVSRNYEEVALGTLRPAAVDATNPELHVVSANKQEGKEANSQELMSVTANVAIGEETVTGCDIVNQVKEITVSIPTQTVDVTNEVPDDTTNQEGKEGNGQELMSVTTNVANRENTVPGQGSVSLVYEVGTANASKPEAVDATNPVLGDRINLHGKEANSQDLLSVATEIAIMDEETVIAPGSVSQACEETQDMTKTSNHTENDGIGNPEFDTSNQEQTEDMDTKVQADIPYVFDSQVEELQSKETTELSSALVFGTLSTKSSESVHHSNASLDTQTISEGNKQEGSQNISICGKGSRNEGSSNNVPLEQIKPEESSVKEVQKRGTDSSSESALVTVAILEAPIIEGSDSNNSQEKTKLETNLAGDTLHQNEAESSDLYKSYKQTEQIIKDNELSKHSFVNSDGNTTDVKHDLSADIAIDTSNSESENTTLVKTYTSEHNDIPDEMQYEATTNSDMSKEHKNDICDNGNTIKQTLSKQNSSDKPVLATLDKTLDGNMSYNVLQNQQSQMSQIDNRKVDEAADDVDTVSDIDDVNNNVLVIPSTSHTYNESEMTMSVEKSVTEEGVIIATVDHSFETQDQAYAKTEHREIDEIIVDADKAVDHEDNKNSVLSQTSIKDTEVENTGNSGQFDSSKENLQRESQSTGCIVSCETTKPIDLVHQETALASMTEETASGYQHEAPVECYQNDMNAEETVFSKVEDGQLFTLQEVEKMNHVNPVPGENALINVVERNDFERQLGSSVRSDQNKAYQESSHVTVTVHNDMEQLSVDECTENANKITESVQETRKKVRLKKIVNIKRSVREKNRANKCDSGRPVKRRVTVEEGVPLKKIKLSNVQTETSSPVYSQEKNYVENKAQKSHQKKITPIIFDLGSETSPAVLKNRICTEVNEFKKKITAPISMKAESEDVSTRKKKKMTPIVFNQDDVKKAHHQRYKVSNKCDSIKVQSPKKLPVLSNIQPIKPVLSRRVEKHTRKSPYKGHVDTNPVSVYTPTGPDWQMPHSENQFVFTDSTVPASASYDQTLPEKTKVIHINPKFSKAKVLQAIANDSGVNENCPFESSTQNNMQDDYGQNYYSNQFSNQCADNYTCAQEHENFYTYEQNHYDTTNYSGNILYTDYNQTQYDGYGNSNENYGYTSQYGVNANPTSDVFYGNTFPLSESGPYSSNYDSSSIYDQGRDGYWNGQSDDHYSNVSNYQTVHDENDLRSYLKRKRSGENSI